MNRIINDTINFFTTRPVVLIVLIIVVLALVLGGFSWFLSRKYDKDRLKYEQESKAWATERAGLIANAEAKEKRIAELEPKAIAFDALAEQNKKIDAGLAQQIEEVSKNAANEEVLASHPTDCRVRARRVCDLLSANRIVHDCERITKESCPAGQ